MSQTPSVEEVMARIRAQVRQQHGDIPAAKAPAAGDGRSRESAPAGQRPRQQPAPTPPAGGASGQQDLSRLRSEVGGALAGHLQVGQLNPRPPGLHNDALQFVKKVMRRSLTWYTRPIHLFQGSVIRALQQITEILQTNAQNYADNQSAVQQEMRSQSAALRQNAEQIATTRSELARLRETVADKSSEQKLREELRAEVRAEFRDELQKTSTSQAQQLDSLRTEVQALQQQLRDAAARDRGKDRDYRRLLHALEAGKSASQPSSPIPPMFPSEIKQESEFDYFLFEEHYRGSEDDIRQRQKSYLEFFRGRDNVVDIGCGRGEFLELLRDNNITARGIELGTDPYLLCREKGLEVLQENLFTFLESTPDDSLGGLFSAQVIEHLTASDQLRFVSLAYRKCKAGSPVIFETINPECVYALVHNFFLDPTHVRPVHPGTLQFAMQSAKFRDVRILFSSQAGDKHIPRLQLNGDSDNLQRFNNAMEQVNELLYGYQDYAALGWK